jgi:hypothetical protein
MLGLSRVLAIGLALIIIAFGVWMAFSTEVGLPLIGLFVALLGVGLLAALLFERMRYQSEDAERVALTPASPGGDPAGAPLEPRFRRTDEVFIDPTSGRQMRVFADPTTGERRYRTEG